MARSWSRRSVPDESPGPMPAESLWTILAKAMGSFGCAVRLVFVLCSVMVVFCCCLAMLLLVLKWVGLTGAVAAGGNPAGAGAAVVAGTGLAAPVVALIVVLLRRGRKQDGR